MGECPHHLMNSKLPFQFNIDLMNAVSLKKGCYIGQETISRGMLTGIIRRRVFPFEMEQEIEVNAMLKGEDGTALGKVVTSKGRKGLALVNYLSLLENKMEWPLRISSPCNGQLISPFHSKLVSYY